ncbi:MAG: [FeFe] hydrogenase H-cluster radical SAM maturase HydG [Planctomycetaceae bacterium]|jgi:2-iminoacetate synthase|nr:[FeFe] hydrogenase H-cluster radical SAM maturase HydG [Planctomycetaceae bacterium]
MSTLFDMTHLSASGVDFIDEPKLFALLKRKPDEGRFRDAVAKAKEKTPLNLDETAELLNADKPEQTEEVFEVARQLKRDVYGNRIVLFAPLYIGNLCMNNCVYCGFRASNKDAVRRTLSKDEITREVQNMLMKGHKRTIIVFGEHAKYPPEMIADTVRHIYSVNWNGHSMRRINVNAAPLDHAGYRTVAEAGIGTYQVFQETYHHETYSQMHPSYTRKGNYLWRLDSPARALESGQEDVGLGVLFGLADWRFETLALVAHSIHLMSHHGVGPHTLSFPRIQTASGVDIEAVNKNDVNDRDFLRLVATLRLAVPYTGLIMTAREPAHIRKEGLGFGVSQIDAGARVEIGGYTEIGDAQTQVISREQFELSDIRPLDDVILQLLEDGFVPSFCTACYRLGRTGEIFMEYAIPGFIQDMCTPNALTTLQEYIVDFASPETRAAGEKTIRRELDNIPAGERKLEILDRLERIRNTKERDLYF